MQATRIEVADTINHVMSELANKGNYELGMSRATFVLRLESVMYVRPALRKMFIEDMVEGYLHQELDLLTKDKQLPGEKIIDLALKSAAEVDALVERLKIPLE